MLKIILLIKSIISLLIGKDHRQIFNSNTKYKFKIILELSIDLFKLFLRNFLFQYKLYKVNKILNITIF